MQRRTSDFIIGKVEQIEGVNTYLSDGVLMIWADESMSWLERLHYSETEMDQDRDSASLDRAKRLSEEKGTLVQIAIICEEKQSNPYSAMGQVSLA